MPGIIYCSKCGALVESNETRCHCCGAAIDNKQGQQQNGQPNFGYDSYNQNQSGMFGQQPNFNQGMSQPLQYENYNQYAKNDGAYNGCAITGLVLGILSIVLCCALWFDLLIGVAGIELSIIGLKSYQYKGCSIAGLVCSIIGTLLSVIIFIAVF